MAPGSRTNGQRGSTSKGESQEGMGSLVGGDIDQKNTDSQREKAFEAARRMSFGTHGFLNGKGGAGSETGNGSLRGTKP